MLTNNYYQLCNQFRSEFFWEFLFVPSVTITDTVLSLSSRSTSGSIEELGMGIANARGGEGWATCRRTWLKKKKKKKSSASWR